MHSIFVCVNCCAINKVRPGVARGWSYYSRILDLSHDGYVPPLASGARGGGETMRSHPFSFPGGLTRPQSILLIYLEVVSIREGSKKRSVVAECREVIRFLRGIASLLRHHRECTNLSRNA